MLVLGLLALFAGLLLALTTIGVLTDERAQVGRSLAAVRAIGAAPSAMRRELEVPFADRVTRPLLARLTSSARRVSGSGSGERYRHRLELAGSPPAWDVDRVLAFKGLGVLAGLLVGLVVPWLLGAGPVTVLGVGLALAVLGFFVPDLVLYQVAYDRTDRIRGELPNALDLLTISVEAGLAFDAALSQVARNTTGPLAAELFRVLQEMQIGMGRTDAMRALAERSSLPELKSFVSAMVQAEAFGIPTANVLRVQSREMRLKRRQWAEEKAQKIPVKILFPLIFLVMPAMFVVLVGPAVLQLIKFFG